MAIFRKKHQQRAVDEDRLDSSIYEEETSTVSKSKSKNRRMSKWVCGSKDSKQTIEEDNKISTPPHKSSGSYANSPGSYASSPGSSASTTSSSSGDRRDDRQNSFSRTASPRDRNYMDDNSLISSIPPPAAKSAFNGPPRFDWIDVEYHAATRVQKFFRRYLVLQEMEEAGLTTSYIRNRRRERKAKATYYTPSFEEPDVAFGCCSMGLAFGGDDLQIADSIAYRDYHRKKYEEKKISRKEREDFLSQSYHEQKGIPLKFEELEQKKFRDQSLLIGEESLEGQ